MTSNGLQTAAPRVVVFDHQALFRRGLRKLLSDAGIEVSADTDSSAEVAALAARLAPDVVSIDLDPAAGIGAGLIGEVLAAAPRAQVLILTACNDEELVLDAVRGGARGYVLKTAPADEIAQAVHAVSAGHSPVSANIAGTLLERIRTASWPEASAGDRYRSLTPRELEVLKLLAGGKDNVQIGQALFLSPSTVKHHVSRILMKLDTTNRVQAAVVAMRAGLV
jgi:DNA-binding NarL/FixJ family response regulator